MRKDDAAARTNPGHSPGIPLSGTYRVGCRARESARPCSLSNRGIRKELRMIALGMHGNSFTQIDGGWESPLGVDSPQQPHCIKQACHLSIRTLVEKIDGAWYSRAVLQPLWE